MVVFTINDKEYKTPDGWSKVKFGKYLDSLTLLEPRYPLDLKVFIENHHKNIKAINQDLSDSEKQHEAIRVFEEKWNEIDPVKKTNIHKYMAFVISYWCGEKATLIQEAMDLEQLEQTFWVIEYELNPNNAEVNPKWAGFTIGGVEYLPPKEHMKGSTVVEFAESAQFQSALQGIENGNWKAMEDVMVVLCRPKGEPYYYEEEKHEKRKKLFRDITMDNVINLAFFLLKLNNILRDNLLIYTLEQERLQRKEKLIQIGMDGRM